MPELSSHNNFTFVTLADICDISVTSAPGNQLVTVASLLTGVCCENCLQSAHIPIIKTDAGKQPQTATQIIQAAGAMDEQALLAHDINAAYLFYYLQYRRRHFSKTAITADKISLAHLQKIVVPVPAINIQKQIVQTLDKKLATVEESIKLYNDQLIKLKHDQDQRYNKLFSKIKAEKIVAIKEAGIIQVGKTPNSSLKKYFGNEYPFYNLASLSNDMYIDKPAKYLSARGAKESKTFRENSVLVCHIGSKFGKAAIATKTGSCSSQLISIMPFPFVAPDYLFFQICAPQFQQQMLDASSNASIKKADFENLSIAVPTMKKQEQLTEILRAQLNEYNRSNKELQLQLKKAEEKKYDLLAEPFEKSLVIR